jgi:DNA-binding SARP family transcriptional activator/tetratricopeptide (TPR) repeat protein
MTTQFRLLGPLQVENGGGLVRLNGPKRRALTAYLVVHREAPCSVGRIVDALWDGGASAGAEATVRTYVSQLRGLLKDDGLELASRHGGYVLDVKPDWIDVVRFERAINEALSGTSADRRLRHVEEALELWRGEPLDEFAGAPWADDAARYWTRLRMLALERKVNDLLETGKATDALITVETAVSEHRLHEPLWIALMLARYRCGRQADALSAAREARQVLATELGIDPGPELVELEQRILTQDPTLLQSRGEPSVVGQRSPLPAGVVTFLLTDIVGSTQHWESEANDMSRALLRHDELLAEAVATHGGVMLKHRGEGDSTFSVFARATDAVAGALDAQRALAQEEWATSVPLAVRMAVHTGEALERDGDYYGRTVNRAARLRSRARGGQILVSHSAAEVVRDHLGPGSALQELGEITLADLDRPERVFALSADGVSGTPPSVDHPFVVEPLPLPSALARTAATPFVGRGAEVARLDDRWKAATSTPGAAVFIAGEPGIGKSRLAAEFALAAHADGAAVLYGRCGEGLEVPYQPFIEALRGFVAHVPQVQLPAALGASGAELSRLVPELATQGLGGHTSADPDTDRYRLFEAVADWLATTAAHRPTVLVLDDLQWATKATVLLVHHLVQASALPAVMVVGTYRDTELAQADALQELLADLAANPGYVGVNLSGLDPDAVTELVEYAVGTESSRRGVAQFLVPETNGNPLFVAEMLRHMRETGTFSSRLENEDWSGRGMALPETVRGVIERRLQRLSEASRHALTVAAVFGPEFSLTLLEEVAQPTQPAAILDALDEAVAARVITETKAAPGNYAFDHDVIREVVVAALSATRRARLHWQIAEALASITNEPRSPSTTTQLGTHAKEGMSVGDARQAADWLEQAGKAALDQFAYEEALAYFRAMLAALDRGPADPEQRYRGLIGIGTAGNALVAFDTSYPAWLEAASIANSLQDPTKLGIVRVATYGFGFGIRVGQWDDELERLVNESLELVGPRDSGLRAELLAFRAVKKVRWASPTVLRADGADALAMARRVGDPTTLAYVLNAMSWLYEGSDAGPRREFLREQLECDEAIGREEPVTYILLGSVELQLGEIDKARRTLQYGLDLAREQHKRLPTTYGLIVSAAAALMEGHFSEAERLAAEAHVVGDPRNEVVTLGYQAQMCAARVEQGHAAQFLSALQAVTTAMPLLGAWRAMLAALYGELGQAPDARREFQLLAENGFSAVPRDGYFPLAIRYLAELCCELHEPEPARELLQEVEPYAGQLLVVGMALSVEGAADRSLGQLYWTIGRPDDAEKAFSAALELETEVGASPLAARTRYWHAKFLAQTGPNSDSKRAAVLLDDAIGVTGPLGMTLLERQARELREDL